MLFSNWRTVKIPLYFRRIRRCFLVAKISITFSGFTGHEWTWEPWQKVFLVPLLFGDRFSAVSAWKTFSQLWHLKQESFRIYEAASLQLAKIGLVPVLPNATVALALYAFPCLSGLRFDSLTARCNLSKIATWPPPAGDHLLEIIWLLEIIFIQYGCLHNSICWFLHWDVLWQQLLQL